MKLLGLIRQSDERIVRRVMAGRRNDFGILVERYLHVVHAVAYSVTGNRADAEDVAQETFLKAFQNLGGLRETAKFGSWLVSIARNAATSLVRTAQRRQTLLDSQGVPMSPSPAQTAEQEELRDVLRREIDKLDDASREILLLHYYASKSCNEIAQLLDITRDATKKRLSRAREKLNANMLDALRPSAESARSAKEQAAHLMGIVMAAPVTWEAANVAGTALGASGATATGTAAAGAAAAGAKTLGGILVVKKSIIAVCAIAALVGGSLFVHQAMQPAEEDPSMGAQPIQDAALEAGAAAPETPEANDSPLASPPAEPKSSASAVSSSAASGNPSGAGTLRCEVLDLDGAPIANAVVDIERVTWRDDELPASDSSQKSATTDEAGKVQFAALPLGDYAVLAEGQDCCGFNEATLDAQHPECDVQVRVSGKSAIAGRVLSSTGEPIAGALVCPVVFKRGLGALIYDGAGPMGMRVTTDAAGAFAFDALREAGAWQLRVSAQGYGTVTTEPIESGKRDAEVVLQPEAVISGFVVLADGSTPVDGVQVSVRPKDGRHLRYQSRGATTDAQGWFRVGALDGGEYLVSIKEGTFALVGDAPTLTLADGEEKTDLLLKVASGASIAGRVFDSDTGQGVGGVTIYAEPSATAQRPGGRILSANPMMRSQESREAVSDASGHYQIVGLTEGEQVVRREEIDGYPKIIVGKPILVVTKLGETVEGADFPLSKGLSVTGRVVNPEGQPVERAIVHGQCSSPTMAQWGITDANGEFELLGFKSGLEVQLRAEIAARVATQYFPSHASTPTAPMEIPDSGLHDVVLTMYPTGTISGIVVDPSGRPAANAGVSAGFVGSSGGRGGRTDASGCFTVAGLAPGPYRLVLSSPGADNFDWQNEAANVELKAGQTVTGLRLVLGAAGRAIAGRVTDESGAPIADVNVLARPQDVLPEEEWPATVEGGACSTNKDGSYRIAGLAEGTYTVSALHLTHNMATQSDVVAGNEQVDFVLDKLGAIEGRVVRADTGEPVTDFEVAASALSQCNFVAFHDAEGRFHLDNVPNSVVTVLARAKGLAAGSTRIDSVPPGETVTDVVVRLEHGARLSGVVVDARGVAVSKAMVFIGTLPSPLQRIEANADAISREDGTFDIESAPSLVERLIAWRQGYAPGLLLLEGNVADAGPVEIVMKDPARIEGVVSLGDRPLSRQPVMIYYGDRPDEASLQATILAGCAGGQSEQDGQYRVDGLTPGEIDVVADLHPSYMPPGVTRRLHRKAIVEGNGMTTVDIAFAEGAGSVYGTVVKAGAPLAGATVILQFTNPTGADETVVTRTNDDGVYRFEALPCVTATLKAAAGRGESAQGVASELAEGGTQCDIEIPDDAARPTK